MIETDNVLPIRKVDKFFLCKAIASKSGDLIEQERVGVAYLKPGSTMFRLRLWMFPKGDFFLARELDNHAFYTALCREDFETPDQGTKNQWHKIGAGELHGNFIRIRFHLLSDDIYLCLFPNSHAKEVCDAV